MEQVGKRTGVSIESAAWSRRRILAAGAVAIQAFATPLGAQSLPRGIGPDSAEVVVGPLFQAGALHRKILGDNYRDLWTRPVRLPVLHISAFAGGLAPLKIGGGKQTRSLRLTTSDSVEYVFRPIFKVGVNLPDEFKGSLVWWIFRDEGSASHPAATVAAVPPMNVARILHPDPILVVMGDDPALAEFRKEFAGMPGTIEIYPTVPNGGGKPFAGARAILDAEELLDSLNANPDVRVDDRTMLRARLVDLLIGDNDRHADQWRWARLEPGGPFKPVARDRDKVFLSYEGLLPGLARKFAPALVRFLPEYSDPTALFENATHFDRRILGGLPKSQWEATAREVEREFTDSIIELSVAAMPAEYRAGSRHLVPILEARRDSLHVAAMRYYTELFDVVDLHGTDAADNARITRNPDGTVRVTLWSLDRRPWFDRQFDPADTRELRLYLHGGDDNAVVTGSAATSIPVRVIGGNGTNTLRDEAIVGGRHGTAKFYDQGTVTNVKYAPDKALEERSYVDALNGYYNRRPRVHAFGTLVPPQLDHGSTIKPVVGLKTGHGLGLVPKIGVARYVYGFRTVPYASKLEASVAMSTATRGLRVQLLGDKRFESSDVHIPATASMSQLEVIQFRGFGNDVAEDEDPIFDVHQRQWSFRPAVGFSFAPGSDVSVGPIIRYTTTDSARSEFLAVSQPYGFSRFAQAGAQLALQFDSRIEPDSSRPRFIVDFAASAYPGAWDVARPYQSIEGVAVGYATIPLPSKPVIALRGGGKKLYGDFPYFDAAFVGGGSTFRTEHRQRFAGDASMFGSAELRVPLFRIPLIFPTDVGALGFTDAARVYVDGESPGGWHTAAGGGFWIGLVNAATNVNVLFTNNSNRRVMVSLGFAY